MINLILIIGNVMIKKKYMKIIITEEQLQKILTSKSNLNEAALASPWAPVQRIVN